MPQLTPCRRFRPLGSFFLLRMLLFVVLGMPQPGRGQEQANPAPPACVPSDLSALMVPEAGTVQVHQYKEESGGNGGPAQAMPGSRPVTSPTESPERRRAYEVLSQEAQRGSPAAMVDLAVSSLAGWGTKPNAGTALYWLHAAADRGYGAALYDLGIMHFKGCGVRADPAEAFHFFDVGARAGYLAAQVNLGYFYDHGLGVARDQGAAAHWYRQAAEGGDAQAQYNLGDLLLRGEGVRKDEWEAFAWFQKAALQGHTGGQIMTGAMLAAGRGESKDLVAAYFWILTASLEGDERAAALLPGLQGQLTSEQIEQAKSRAELRLAGLQAAKK